MNENDTIVIIGAGHIGLSLAHKLVNAGMHVTLFNRAYSQRTEIIKEEVEKINNEALDNGNNGKIEFTNDLDTIKNAKIVNYIAGATRQAGEERSKLLEKNIKICDEYINETFLKNNPDAIIINTVNPLDVISYKIYSTVEKYKAKNLVLGMGNSLDTERLHTVLKEEYAKKNSSVSKDDIKIEEAYVVGTHNNNMVIVLNKCTINGIAINKAFNQNEIQNITEKVKTYGAYIIAKTQHSDVEGPAKQLLSINDAIYYKKEISKIPLSIKNQDGCFLGQLTSIKNGKVIALDNELNNSELELLRRCKEQALEDARQLKTDCRL